MRKPIIAGNWKMNKSSADAADLAREVIAAVGKEHDVEVVLCPPFTALESVAAVLEGSAVKLGAQNMHFEPSGAFTGEISAGMLRHLFATYVIVGHSERRQHFHESDEGVNRKVLAALKSQLKPILCVGETLQERDAGRMLTVVERQVSSGLDQVTPEQLSDVVIAYEPVWAIGTGRNATPAQAQEVHGFIRQLIGRKFGKAPAQKLRVLYGGSMKPSNAPDLLKQEDIDGGLIGGASLEARSFVELVKAAAAAVR